MKNTAHQILILGAGQMQEPAIRTANEMGLTTIVVDGDPAAPFARLAARFFPLDLKDKDAILELASRLKETENLAAVFTAGTDFSSTVAYIAEKLGLPGNSYETALKTTHKAQMRAAFDVCGVPSPRFVTWTQADLAGAGRPRLGTGSGADAPPPLSFPLVVKPVDNMGGRGCRKVSSEAELTEAACDAIRFSRSGSVIVEEYIDGPEFSIDSIVYQNNIYIAGFADRHIFFPPYFVEMGHTIPTALDAAAAEEIIAVFKAGVRSLGITSGCAKGDVKLSARGPVIGEIASRLSGGYMSGWTYPYSSGAELTRAAILAALGRPAAEVEAALRVSHNSVSAERAFISMPGTVREVLGAGTAEKTPFVKNVFFRAAAGSAVDFPRNNVSKCGNVISAAPTRAEAVFAAESACRAVLLPLRCPDAATDAFLAEPAATEFPPSAFVLTAAQHQKLAELPFDTRLPSLTDFAAKKAAVQNAVIFPFDELLASPLHDWHGRTAAESIAVVRQLTGFALPLAETGDTAQTGAVVLAKTFWTALVRGGYQGAAYYIEKLYTA
jgi:biotin carboxylase